MVERLEDSHETPDNRLGGIVDREVQEIVAESRFAGLSLSDLRGRAAALGKQIAVAMRWTEKTGRRNWPSSKVTESAAWDVRVLEAERKILGTFLANAEAEWESDHRSVKNADWKKAGKSKGEVKASRRSELALKRRDQLAQNEAAKRDWREHNRPQARTEDKGRGARGRDKGPTLDGDGRRFAIGQTAKEVKFPGSREIAFTIVAGRDQRTNKDIFQVLGNPNVFKSAAFKSSLNGQKFWDLNRAIASCAEEAANIATSNDRFSKEPHGKVVSEAREGGRTIKVSIHRPQWAGPGALTQFELNIIGGAFLEELQPFGGKIYTSIDQAEGAVREVKAIILEDQRESRGRSGLGSRLYQDPGGSAYDFGSIRPNDRW